MHSTCRSLREVCADQHGGLRTLDDVGKTSLQSLRLASKVTACLGDGIILFFFLVQKKGVVHREVWTEKMKSRKRMWWRIRT